MERQIFVIHLEEAAPTTTVRFSTTPHQKTHKDLSSINWTNRDLGEYTKVSKQLIFAKFRMERALYLFSQDVKAAQANAWRTPRCQIPGSALPSGWKLGK